MEVTSQPSLGAKHTSNDGPSPATAARDDDVGLVVARAKKAAASLWMMIHAEVSKEHLPLFWAHLVPYFFSGFASDLCSLLCTARTTLPLTYFDTRPVDFD